jgi:Tol biopolymer transport system component
LIARGGHNPRFSPDGNWIAYFVRGGLYSSVYVVPAGGGQPRQLQANFALANHPIWSPDGKQLLFLGVRDFKDPPEERRDWWVAPVSGGVAAKTGALSLFRRQGLLDAGFPEHWVRGHVFFSARLGDSTNLWQTALSPNTGHISSVPRRLTFGAGVEGQPSVSAGGLLVFSNLVSNIGIWALPIQAGRGKVVGAPQLSTQDATIDRLPSISLDGKKVSFIANRFGNDDVWVKDLESGKETAIAATRSEEYYPVISSDGSKVAYGVLEGQRPMIYTVAVSGGVAERVCEDCGPPTGWSRDGKRILFQYKLNQPQSSIGLLDLASREKVEILKHSQYNLYRGHFSPDDRWIAVHANSPRGTRVFVVPFSNGSPPRESEWLAVTDGATFDDAPRWSPDGNLLYFIGDRDGSRCIWAQRLHSATKQPVGPPFAVQHFHNARRSLSSVPLSALDICVARDKLVFNMGTLTGNLWMTRIE